MRKRYVIECDELGDLNCNDELMVGKRYTLGGAWKGAKVVEVSYVPEEEALCDHFGAQLGEDALWCCPKCHGVYRLVLAPPHPAPLKPCPFCGGKPLRMHGVEERVGGNVIIEATCPQCNVTLPESAWNRRAGDR